MTGSGLILTDVLRNPGKRQKIYYRILLGMSVYDLIGSCVMFIGTWFIPKTFPIYGAIGNQMTCTIQGAISMYSHAVPLYNSFLAVHYVLRVRYRFSEKRLRRIEWPIHLSIFLFITSGVIASIATSSLNPSGAWCWLDSVPSGCHKSEKECVRGENAYLLRWLFAFSSVIGSMIVVSVSMLVLYRTVKNIEANAARYAGRRIIRDPQSFQKSREVGNQALFYVLSFYACMIPSSISRVVEILTGKPNIPLLYVGIVMYPAQGFFNLLVYMRSNNWDVDGIPGRNSVSRLSGTVFSLRSSNTRNHGLY
mmetsp:Transcript_30092/g.44601  ORF Transcript_30092/g.44601 Transcript_30092/m.44601 type:complete len:308 (+) Transcript_30092:3-926(+)